MDLTRRKFIKSTAVALASAAAAGTLASVAQRQGMVAGTARADEASSAASVAPDGSVTPADGTYQGVCRFCGCGCGILATVQDGTVTSVMGDPQNTSNRGNCCVKGYHLAKILYGSDRLTTPLIRDDSSTKGTGVGSGLREATWDEALDLVADKLKAAWKEGPNKIALWASGQQPILEGYVTSKFWKAGLLSNNVECNARLCMASAVVGFMNIYQTDEPNGCYEDIDDADVFVTWGANMAEAHPMLFSRLAARKLADDSVRFYDLTTMPTRTSKLADKVIVFRPGSDVAIANYIANYLVQNGGVDEQFVADHLQFKRGTEDLGDAFEDGYDATDKGKAASDVESIDFDAYKASLEPYTAEYVSGISGVSVEDLQEIASVYAEQGTNVLSLWTMGVNQHNRGTWMNHNLHNIHLLSGKFGRPGCGPFSLTGQPTACGTAREVGTFSHRLPADLLVANEQHRRYTEACWDLPEGYLEPLGENPGMHTVKMFRELSNGNIDFMWSMHNNWAVSMPNLTRFLGRDGQHDGVFSCFNVVSEVYPTLSTQYADVVFPVSMWMEREGQFGNGERHTAVFEQAVLPPGDARWDMWVMMEVARRVLDGEKIGDQDAFDLLFDAYYDKEKGAFKGTQREVSESMWDEYRIFSNPEMSERAQAICDDVDGTYGAKLKMHAKRLAPYDEILSQHGMIWPAQQVDGTWYSTKYRFCDGDQKEGYDQLNIAEYGDSGLAGNVSFYKSADHRPSVVFRPYEPPAEEPSDEYPFWFNTGRLLEHWHTGSMTRRVPELHAALPQALLYMNARDCRDLGVTDGDMVRVTSRYGSVDIQVSTDGRVDPPAGSVFAPFFAEETLVNLAVQDIYDPLSKEPDFKKSCVRIEKLDGVSYEAPTSGVANVDNDAALATTVTVPDGHEGLYDRSSTAACESCHTSAEGGDGTTAKLPGAPAMPSFHYVDADAASGEVEGTYSQCYTCHAG